MRSPFAAITQLAPRISAAALLTLGVAYLPLGCAVETGGPEVVAESNTLKTVDGDYVVHVNRLSDGTVGMDLFAKDGTPLARTRYVAGPDHDALEWEMVALGEKGVIKAKPDADMAKRELVDYIGFPRFLYEDRINGKKLYDNRGCDAFISSTGNHGACCDAHDDCFNAHNCTAWSWVGNILGGYLYSLLSACGKCNNDVAKCAAGPATGPSTCVACGDCGQPWPWSHNGNTYSNGTATGRSKWLKCDGSTNPSWGGGGSSSGGGGTGTGCFIAGTAVTMADGTTKSIESIEVGEYVLAYDTATGLTSSRRVDHRFVHEGTTEPIVRVNENLYATANHPFYAGGRWMRADQIQPGDALIMTTGDKGATRMGHASSLSTIHEGIPTVYNLEVEGVHTYFAGGILVHNRPKDLGGGGLDLGDPFLNTGAF